MTVNKSLSDIVRNFNINPKSVSYDEIKRLKELENNTEGLQSIKDIAEIQGVGDITTFLRKLDDYDIDGVEKSLLDKVTDKIKNLVKNGEMSKPDIFNEIKRIDPDFPEAKLNALYDKAVKAANQPSVSKQLNNLYDRVGGIYGIAFAAIVALFVYNFILEEGNVKEALKQTASDLGEVGGEVASAVGETGGAFLGGIFEGMGIWLILAGVLALLLLIIML